MTDESKDILKSELQFNGVSFEDEVKRLGIPTAPAGVAKVGDYYLKCTITDVQLFYDEAFTKPRYIGQMYGSKRHGVGLTYLSDGSKESSGIYCNDKLIYGKYYRFGKIFIGPTGESRHHYYTCGLTGSGCLLHGDGKLYQIGNFKDGELHGFGRVYNPDGSIKSQGVFAEGQLIQRTEVKIDNPYFPDPVEEFPKPQDRLCRICKTEKTVMVFLACKHMNACEKCAEKTNKEPGTSGFKKYECPTCAVISPAIFSVILD